MRRLSIAFIVGLLVVGCPSATSDETPDSTQILKRMIRCVP